MPDLGVDALIAAYVVSGYAASSAFNPSVGAGSVNCRCGPAFITNANGDRRAVCPLSLAQGQGGAARARRPAFGSLCISTEGRR